MSKSSQLGAVEILDSRGNPTVQVTVTLGSGAIGVATFGSFRRKTGSGGTTGWR
jgi:enolase